MKKIITLVACIAIAASIGGCGKKNNTGSTENNTSQTEAVKSDSRIVKVGDEDVSDTAYNFFYKNIASNTKNEADATKYTNEQIKEFYTAIGLGKKLNLDASAKDSIVSSIKSSYNTDEEYQKFLEEQGIDQTFIDLYAEANAYNEAIYNYVKDNVKSDTDPNEYFKNNYLRAKHVLIKTEGLSDDEKAEKKKLADEIYERAKNGEDFDKLVEEYSEDPGSKSQPDGYVFPEGQMVDEFYQGTKNIGIGEYNLVESSFGYHIIKRLALDETQELYDKFYKESNVEQQIETEKMRKFIDDKSKEYNIEVKYQK